MTGEPDATKHSPSRAERHAAGKALRAKVSLGSHADFSVDPRRDPLPILRVSDPQRVQSLVPERYRRMAASPFAFYRGAAALMAHDLTLAPQIGLPVQACGDCHLMNFGVFSSPEGDILFDINDFDETYPGVDFIVDVKRLAASVLLAAQQAQLSDRVAQTLVRATVKAYREFIGVLANRSPLEVWHTRIDLRDQLKRLKDADLKTKILTALLKAEKKRRKARDHPPITADARAFEDEPGRVFHHFADGAPVRPILSDAARAAYEATLPPEQAALLRRYAVRDVAFKVVGVGSVGTFCLVALLATAEGELLVLQWKQAWQSMIAGLASGTIQDSHQGKRIVDGQRAMQAASDVFLGWTQDDTGRQFYVRQLKNRRLASIGEEMESKALAAYAILCGRTLARAHARTGDPAMISGYLGDDDTFDEALTVFAIGYARQTVADWEKLKKSGLTGG